MIPRPGRVGSLTAFLLIGVLAAAGCSKSYSPTAPYGGGGGGGGGGMGAVLALGPFGLGQSAQVTFSTAGTFGYHCIPHQSMGMVGSVQVDNTGSDSVVVQIAPTGLNFVPSLAHLKPGGYVRWVNASSSTIHTVTSN